jgi:hypothetical protein
MTPPVTRAGLASASLAAFLTCAALMLVSAAPAAAVTRKQAERNALAALGSKQAGGPVVVFGMKKSLRPGTRVTQARANGSKRLLLRVRSERAFFFFEDATPFSLYRHRGRVALVGAKSGRVRMSMVSAPLFASGKLPVQVGSSNSTDSIYRVYYRVSSNLDSTSTQTQTQSATPSAPSTQPGNTVRPNSPPKADRQDARAKQNAPKHIHLTGSDDDGDFITFAITRQPNHGTLSGTPPDMIYTPAPNYLGRDDFAFRTYDDISHSNTAKVSIDVVPLGSPPAMTTSAGCTAYTEKTPAVVVDSLLTVADPDDTTLDSATVRVAANFQESDDLLFTDQSGIVGAYDDDTGVLTLTGTASVANYQAALRSVRFRNLSNGSPSPSKDIEFTVNDAGSDSAPVTKQLCITEPGPNDKPIGETSEGALSYTENDGPISIDAIFDVVDSDSAQLSGATIKFTDSAASEEGELDPGAPGTPIAGYVPSEDSLSFVDQNGITGTWDSGLGVLTLTGTASVADYETALRSAKYENSSEDPSEAPRLVRFQVTDSDGATSVPSSREIFVTKINDAPVVTASDGAATYTEGDGPTAVDSGLTVGDVDNANIEGGHVRISNGFEPGDELAFADQAGINGSYNSDTGVLTLTGTATKADYQAALRSIEFSGTSDDPPATKTVEFVVNDGQLDSDPSARTIAVTGVNDKPVLVASGGALSYTEGDGAVAVDPAITASDVDSASFAGATVAIGAGHSPSEDALAFTAQNGITGAYDSDTGVLTLSGSASVAEYESALQSVTYENSSDDPSTADRTITFQVDDGAATDNLSDPVTRDINVSAVNDAPVVATSADSTPYVAGDPATVVDADVTVADADNANIESAVVRISDGFEMGDDLVFADQPGIHGVYATGTGVLTLTGSATQADYQAALRSILFGHTGADPAASRTVEFTVNDGDLGSAPATKAIDITAPPPPPPPPDE